ncbi:hypothetical protein D3C84_1111500 [compost metagenome]
MITPAFDLGQGTDGLGVLRGTGETQFFQLRDTGRQVRRAVGPFPGKQADPLGLPDAQRLARHQAGYRAAGVEAAVGGLHVVRQAPVELTLHHQVPWR